MSAPSARAWYRAHNASVVAGYVEHREQAELEGTAERFIINVVLCRVLYAHALVAAPRLALGWLRSLGPPLGDPRLGTTAIFLQLSRVLPDEYPLVGDVGFYVTDEQRLGRVIDYGMIVPRIAELFEWSAHELDAPELLSFLQEGAPVYAWPFDRRDVWRTEPSGLVGVARRVLPATASDHWRSL